MFDKITTDKLLFWKYFSTGILQNKNIIEPKVTDGDIYFLGFTDDTSIAIILIVKYFYIGIRELIYILSFTDNRYTIDFVVLILFQNHIVHRSTF